MSDKARNEEDIAGLFAAFGGDVGKYKEFTTAPETESRPGWALLQTLGATQPQAAPATPAVAPTPVPLPPRVVTPAPVPVPAPAIAPPTQAPTPGPLWATTGFRPAAPEPADPPPAARAHPGPVPASAPPHAPAAAPATGTPLAVLFARLAGAPGADAPATRHSLMAHWRQSR